MPFFLPSFFLKKFTKNYLLNVWLMAAYLCFSWVSFTMAQTGESSW